MFKKSKVFFILLSILVIIVGCSSQKDLKIDYEKYVLANGLEVVLHEDKSDPIAAVAVQYHVGSNREVKGRTGFAHLFEHMMFQESQHVTRDQFFKKIGNFNGLIYCTTSLKPQALEDLPGRSGYNFVRGAPATIREMVQASVDYTVSRVIQNIDRPTMAFIKEGPYAIPVLTD